MDLSFRIMLSSFSLGKFPICSSPSNQLQDNFETYTIDMSSIVSRSIFMWFIAWRFLLNILCVNFLSGKKVSAEHFYFFLLYANKRILKWTFSGDKKRNPNKISEHLKNSLESFMNTKMINNGSYLNWNIHILIGFWPHFSCSEWLPMWWNWSITELSVVVGVTDFYRFSLGYNQLAFFSLMTMLSIYTVLCVIVSHLLFHIILITGTS